MVPWSLGAVLGLSWAGLGPVLGRLGRLLGGLGDFLGRFGAYWGRPGPSWGCLGLVLGQSWAVLETSWGCLAPSGRQKSRTRFRSDFGSCFGSNFLCILDYFWKQVGKKKPPKTMEGCAKSRISGFRIRPYLGTVLGGILEAFSTPKSLQNRPPEWSSGVSGSQDSPKTAPRLSQDDPRRAQDSPKTAPDAPKTL